MTFQGEITVSGSGSYLNEVTYVFDDDSSHTSWPSYESYSGYYGSIATPQELVRPQPPYYQLRNSEYYVEDLEVLSGGDIQPRWTFQYQGWRTIKVFDIRQPLERSISWTATSQRTWTYRVINDDGEVVRTGSTTVSGNNDVTVESNLAPDKYTVEFYETSAQRSGGPTYYSMRNGFSNAPYYTPNVQWQRNNIQIDRNYYPREGGIAVRHQNDIRSTYHNSFHADIAGNETVDIQVTQVVEQVFTEIDGPDDGTPLPSASFRDLTLIGIKGGTSALRPVLGPDYFLQLHCFIRDGIQVRQQLQGLALGSSNSYSDLVLHLMERSSMLQSEQIDYPAMLTAARFCEAYKMRFNGILRETNSLAEWMTRTAPYFLLNPRQVDGKHGLAPVVPIGADNKVSLEPVVPVITLTVEDLVNYQRSYLNTADRKPTCMVMMFRQQSETGPGQPRTIEVRYPGTAQDGPFQTHDMTDMVTDINHASIVARYILAKRRYVTHTVSCSIGRHGSFLFPGQIVQIDLGLETTDGEGVTDSKLYEIEEIVEGVNGQVQLELLEFPVDDEGISLIAKDIENGTVEVT